MKKLLIISALALVAGCSAIVPNEGSARLVDIGYFDHPYNEVYLAAVAAVGADGQVRSSSAEQGLIIGGDGTGYWSKTIVEDLGESTKVKHYMDTAYVCCNEDTQQKRTAQILNNISEILELSE